MATPSCTGMVNADELHEREKAHLDCGVTRSPISGAGSKREGRIDGFAVQPCSDGINVLPNLSSMT
jgi:hypothetical protein